jgi:L-lactate dehydrogenase complex protein LldF
VYERTGGQAYGSVYPGPIGAIITPQLGGDMHDKHTASLPYASSLCGACFEVCPVRIDIPEVLVHLRSEVVAAKSNISPEAISMAAMSWVMSGPRRFHIAQRLATAGRLLSRNGKIRKLPFPGSQWTKTRDLPAPAKESFSAWWKRTRG